MLRTENDGDNLTVTIKVDLDFDKTNLKEFEKSIVDALERKGVDPSYISKISFEKGSIIASIECLDKDTFSEIKNVFEKGTPIEFEDQELKAEVLENGHDSNSDSSSDSTSDSDNE